MENWVGDNIVTVITIIVSCFTLLSYYLSINEYYCNKAYWAYYHVNKMYRKEMRSGFQAIYLSVAIIIILIFGVIAYGIYYFWELIGINWIMWCFLLCLITSIVLYSVLRVMTWKIHLVDYNERRAWENKEEHSDFVKMKANLLFLEYGIGISVMFLGLFVCMKSSIYILIILFLLCALVYMQFQSYSNELRLLDFRKWIDIVKVGEIEYALIEVGTDWVYLIQCEEDEKKNELNLLLDSFLVLKSDSLKAKTKYFNKISRICNCNNCNERFVIRRRNT